MEIIPSYLINTYLEKSFKFHSNLDIPANKTKRFPIYYKQIFKRCSENLLSVNRLFHLKFFGIINASKETTKAYDFKMSRKDTNYVGQLFKFYGKDELGKELKNEFNLHGQLQFIYNQIV